MGVCVCVCQNSIMSHGKLVLNPTGKIEGSVNSDRFSIIRRQRRWGGRHGESICAKVRVGEKKDRDREKKSFTFISFSAALTLMCLWEI